MTEQIDDVYINDVYEKVRERESSSFRMNKISLVLLLAVVLTMLVFLAGADIWFFKQLAELRGKDEEKTVLLEQSKLQIIPIKVKCTQIQIF